MSEIEGYACDRNGMLIPTRCRGSNGDECMCWPKIAQPAEAEGVDEFDASCLDEWLRQYCHNDGSPGFVFAYEAKGTGQLVDRLRTALSAVTAERDSLDAECGRLLEGNVQDAETIFVLEAERDQLRAEVEGLREAFMKMRNVAAGYSNCCEFDSANTRRLEREFEAADELSRSSGAMAAKEAQ